MMIRKAKIICLILFSFAYGQNDLLSQCSSGVGSLQTLPTPTSTCSDCSIPFVVWAPQDDSGNGGVTVDPVHNTIESMEEAIAYFNSIGITINACVREIHQTSLLNSTDNRC